MNANIPNSDIHEIIGNSTIPSDLYEPGMTQPEKALRVAQWAVEQEAHKLSPIEIQRREKVGELECFLKCCPTVAFQFQATDPHRGSIRPTAGVMSEIIFAHRTGDWEHMRTYWHTPVETRNAMFDYIHRTIRKLTTELLQCDAKFVLLWMLPCDEKASFCFNGHADEEAAIEVLAVNCMDLFEGLLIDSI